MFTGRITVVKSNSSSTSTVSLPPGVGDILAVGGFMETDDNESEFTSSSRHALRRFSLRRFCFHKPFLGLNRFQILKSSPMLIYPKGHFFVFVYLFVCIFISHYSSSTVSQYQLWARFNECL